MASIRFAAKTDPGKHRANNEDCFLCDEALGLWLVADGMGGHNCGEIASDIASSTIADGLKSGQSLLDSVADAHERIRTQSDNNADQQGMGTTLVAMQDLGDHFQICWVGDSRIYRWNPDREPQFVQLSRDHSYVQELLDSGAINQQEAEQHPQKNIITQSLGCPLETIQIDNEILEWQDGDCLLLCSDGLSDELNSQEITSLLEQPISAEQRINDLIEASLARGGRDNITAVLVIGNLETSTQPVPVKKPNLHPRYSHRLLLSILALLVILYLLIGFG